MKISNLGTCRGNGKVFTKLRISDLKENSTVNISGPTINDVEVPCSILEIPSADSHLTSREYVVSTPFLQFDSCEFHISEHDESGTSVACARFKLHYDIAKWKSRLNYKLNKDLCLQIRDYDRITEFDKASMDFWECIEDREEMVVRGAIYTPYRDDTRLNITCFNSKLEKVDIKIIPFGQSKIKARFSSERSRREFQFSIRLPLHNSNYVFLIEDTNHPSFNNFAALETAQSNALLNYDRKLRTNAQVDNTYPTWFNEKKASIGELSKQKDIHFPNEVSFSIVVPLFRTPLNFYRDMVDSVLSQTYGNWELVLVNASADDDELVQEINRSLSLDHRIRCITLESNLGISGNTNAGINASTGDFVCFFDHDDVLEPDILFAYAEAINNKPETDILYCDEDKLLPSGTLTQPFFKPDFNLELLRNNNYICHMLAIRKSLLNYIEPNSSEYDGAQDHNLVLRASEKARHVEHVPMVLYHWRISDTSTAANSNSKPYAIQAGVKSVSDHLERVGIKGKVLPADRPFMYRVEYDVPESHPLVSILIPTKDQVDILNTCVRSIIEKTTYDNYEVILIENNSTEQSTFDNYERLKELYGNRVKVVTWEHEFNFSKLINFGARHSSGDYLLLLNNDTEVITPDWIELMLGICSQEDVGIVGTRLYFPDNTIQHAGVVIIAGVADHLGRNLPKGDCGYFALLDTQRELSAVTAACMMTDRKTFNSVHGFTEKLQVAFNDVDYCLKVRELSKKVIYTPFVELYHYESISRGGETDSGKRIRFHRECAYMNYRWAEYYINGDPYYNPNLCSQGPLSSRYHL